MKVAIGMPIYNEEKTITKTLDSIAIATKGLEETCSIYVCFNGTTDNSGGVVSDYDRLELKITESEKGKPNAIYQIVKESKEDIILFCDGDIYVEPSCFKNILRNFHDDSVIAVTGCPIPYSSSSLVYNIVNARMLHPFSEIAYTSTDGITDKPFIHGRIFGVRREVFDESFPDDSFVDNLGDDTFLSHYILNKYGRKALKREPEANVRYHAVTSISNWWKKWSRIWGDIEEMYRQNPEFAKLRDSMKTKLDWNHIITLPVNEQLHFILERILHKSGRKLFELTKLNDKPKWERLGDTKQK